MALALIFSIQRCDPAPFYLFDEVDQVRACPACPERRMHSYMLALLVRASMKTHK